MDEALHGECAEAKGLENLAIDCVPLFRPRLQKMSSLVDPQSWFCCFSLHHPDAATTVFASTADRLSGLRTVEEKLPTSGATAGMLPLHDGRA